MLGVTSIAAVAATVILAAAGAYLLPRLLGAILAILAWPLYFLGLVREWWGHGVGDGWRLGAAVLTLAAVLGATAGIFARRARRGVARAKSAC